MPRGFVKTDNFSKETLLRLAGMGVILIVAATSPFFLNSVIRSYFKDKSKKERYKRADKLREFEKRKLITFTELENGKIRIELTKRGQKLVREYNLEDMKLIKPKKWDGIWRIVAYDIPTHQRKASNAFREKLKSLGLFPAQRSIWISPYDCLAEMEFLASVFEIDIDQCLYYLEAHKIPKENNAKRFFNL